MCISGSPLTGGLSEAGGCEEGPGCVAELWSKLGLLSHHVVCVSVESGSECFCF